MSRTLESKLFARDIVKHLVRCGFRGKGTTAERKIHSLTQGVKIVFARTYDPSLICVDLDLVVHADDVWEASGIQDVKWQQRPLVVASLCTLCTGKYDHYWHVKRGDQTMLGATIDHMCSEFDRVGMAFFATMSTVEAVVQTLALPKYVMISSDLAKEYAANYRQKENFRPSPTQD
jgi:hypothetical protein